VPDRNCPFGSLRVMIGTWNGLLPVTVLNRKFPTKIGHPLSPELIW
jgi:hypothetical protein